MHEPWLIPLPLAEVDDIVKVAIAVVFALFWIFAQVAASMTAKKKKQEARQRQRPSMELGVQGRAEMLPMPSLPPATQTQMERQLRARREQADRYRSGGTPIPDQRYAGEPVRAESAVPGSYEELRRQKQSAPAAARRGQMQQRGPQQHPVHPRHAQQRRHGGAQPAPPARTTQPVGGGAARAARAADESQPRPLATGAVTTSEIGSGGEQSIRARRVLAGQRVRAMLNTGSVRDVILAGELLRPPVTLRADHTVGQTPS